MTEAAELYRDDFLAGFSLRDSPSFDDWQFRQTERLRRELADVLQTLIRHSSAGGRYELALQHARRWLSLDPLDESAHRELMRIQYWAGNRSAALRQYRECVRTLGQELSVTPLEETTQLYQSIRENRPSAAPEKAQPKSGSAEVSDELVREADGIPVVRQPHLIPIGKKRLLERAFRSAHRE